MSFSINKKLKQIGRRFSVNGIDFNEKECSKRSRSPSSVRFPSTSSPLSVRKHSNLLSSSSSSSSSSNVDVGHLLNINPFDESGHEQWRDAMRMVVRLPGGIPLTFRSKLWLALSDRYIHKKKIDWDDVCRKCLDNEGNNNKEENLASQIDRDLHRTGFSLFDEEQPHNQKLLKQVLLAYARYNPTVGYCQGFNMLAAIVLEVMEKDVQNSLKVMIFLIEDLLPEDYFCNNLKGLSIDMVVFQDLMHLRNPELAHHLDRLQQDSYDPALGIYYEPPLINALTMQWFLTLFANCLPKSTVLRIWDLLFLEGNEILLRTALVIWDCFSDQIMAVKSADEFYSKMNILTREIIEIGPTDTNEFINNICDISPFPFTLLMELRDNYYKNIRPFYASLNMLKNSFVNIFNQSIQKFLDDDDKPMSTASNEEDSHQNWFEEQILMLNWCLNNSQNKFKGNNSPSKIAASFNSGSNFIESLVRQLQGVNQQQQNNNTTLTVQQQHGGWSPSVGPLDVSLLRKQYSKLKQRQRQVQTILKEGFRNHIQMDKSYDNQDLSKQSKSKFSDTFSVVKLLKGRPSVDGDDKNAGEPKQKPKANQPHEMAGMPRAGSCAKSISERSNTIDSTTERDKLSSSEDNESQSKQSRDSSHPLPKRSSSSSTSTELCDEVIGLSYDDENEDYDDVLVMDNIGDADSSELKQCVKRFSTSLSDSTLNDLATNHDRSESSFSEQTDMLHVNNKVAENPDSNERSSTNETNSTGDTDTSSHILDNTIKMFQDKIRQLKMD